MAIQPEKESEKNPMITQTEPNRTVVENTQSIGVQGITGMMEPSLSGSKTFTKSEINRGYRSLEKVRFGGKHKK